MLGWGLLLGVGWGAARSQHMASQVEQHLLPPHFSPLQLREQHPPTSELKRNGYECPKNTLYHVPLSLEGAEKGLKENAREQQ